MSRLWDAGDEAEGGRVAVSYRLPADATAYIDEVAKEMERDKTEIVASALRLDRDIAKHLDGSAARLKAYASEHGLTVRRDLALVLSKLALLGLDAYELTKKTKR